MLEAFRSAIETGETHEIENLLEDSVRLVADASGQDAVDQMRMTGRKDALAFLSTSLFPFWRGGELVEIGYAGQSFLAFLDMGRLAGLATFTFGQNGLASGVFVIRNPDKLLLLQSHLLSKSIN